MQMKPGFYLTIKTIILKVSENNENAPCFVVIERRINTSWVSLPCSLQSFLFSHKIVKRVGETKNCRARIVLIGSLSTDVREPWTATGSRMFPFWAWFCSLTQTGKALVDDCGLTLQTRWRENAPKREKFNFRLPSNSNARVKISPYWPSNSSNIFFQPVAQQCCIANCDFLLLVSPPTCATNVRVAKSRNSVYFLQHENLLRA